MRAPYQILAIPYRRVGDELQFCVLHRSDIDWWQFVAGGGEDDETPIQAAAREIWEEVGIALDVSELLPLTSVSYVPANVFAMRHREYWAPDTYVLPEHTFAFACRGEIRTSHEHAEYLWLPYEKAWQKLRWQSNKVAMYELLCRLEHAARPETVEMT